MEIPILEGGKRLGILRETREGLYAVLEGSIPLRPGLQRLYVHGAEGSGCLGLLEPRDGRLSLCRRLSRREREKLPAVLRYASLSPETTPERAPRTAPAAAAEALPEGWLRLEDGCLLDPVRGWLALPCQLQGEKGPLRKIRWQGRDYLVFRY